MGNNWNGNKWDGDELSRLYHDESKTLQEIGDIFSVTRERIRQVMTDFNIPRGKKRKLNKPYKSYFRNLSDYLARGKDDRGTMRKLLPDNLSCGECGNKNHLNIHHIKYPAQSLDDIQILCSSCHITKHRSGLSFTQQMELFMEFKSGTPKNKLRQQYKISGWIIDKIIRKFQTEQTVIQE